MTARRRRITARVAMLLAALAAALAFPLAAAYANPGDNITSDAVNGTAGKCLDADLNTFWNTGGGSVQTWNCWGGDNQHWAVDYNNCQWGGDGYYCLYRNDHGNGARCLEATGTANGSAVVVDSCNVNNQYQLWEHTGNNNALWLLPGYHLVLDLNRGCVGSDGCNVQIWSWWGNNNQRWSGVYY